MNLTDLFDDQGNLHESEYGVRCPGISVGAAILGTGHFPQLGDVDDGRIRFLMGRRGHIRTASNPGGVQSEPFRWDWPRGVVHMGERLEHAVRRDVIDKVRVIIDEVRPLMFVEHFPGKQHWLNFVHVVLLDDKSLAPSIPRAERQKCLELRYFTLHEMFEMPRDELTLSTYLALERLADGQYEDTILGLVPDRAPSLKF